MSELSGPPLTIGLFLPSFEYMLDGRTPRWSDILALAQRAEDLGVDALWLGEHLLFRFAEPHPWTGQAEGGAWDCWALLAALAARTQRLTLGPLVSCTSFHNPVMLAKMADTIDEIAGGRMILGLGAGWNADEYRACGVPFDHRVSRFAEAITIIHTLLHVGHIDFSGAYYQARACELRPRGPRPAGPPLLVGTTGSGMLRLAARYADLWNVDLWGVPQPEELAPLRTAVDAACWEVGRDPATLTRTVGLTMNPMGRDDIPRSAAIRGSAQELAGVLLAWAREGVSHIQVCLLPNTRESLEAFAPTLALLRGS